MLRRKWQVVRVTGATVITGAAIGAGPAQAATTLTLKPQQTRSWSCSGSNACVRAMRVVGGERMARIAPGCWAPASVFGESCTVATDCRSGRCWARNGSRVTVRVTRR